MTVSRRKALLLGAPGLGLVAAAAYPGAAAAEVQAAHAGQVPAPDLGIAPSNTPAANRTALIAALSGSAASVVFPPGDYQIDNSGDTIRIPNFSGEVVMRPGARLVFTDNTRRGLYFSGGRGARLYGLTTVFASRPALRHNAEECVAFDRSEDTYIENVRIDGSAAAGLLFWQCVRPMVVDAVITNTMADGLHFANCQDGRADHITTADTGDDGVAFVNYAQHPNNTGGLATNVSVTRSRARGVAVVGQSGVTVRDVVVRETVGHGLYCAQEPNWNTRAPADVRFERALVYRGGAYVAGGGGNGPGVHVIDASRVTISDAVVEAPGGHGVFVIRSTTTLLDITVREAPLSGFNLQYGAHRLDRLTTEESGGIGFFASYADRLEYGTVVVRNAAKNHHLRRAVDVEHNKVVTGERLWVYDTQPTPTGYIVGAYGTQRGFLGTVVAGIAHGTLTIENPSGLAHTKL